MTPIRPEDYGDSQLEGVIGEACIITKWSYNGNGHHQPEVTAPVAPPLNPDIEPVTTSRLDLIRRLCKEQERKAPVGALSKAAASQIINNLLEEDNGAGGQSRPQPVQRQTQPANGNGHAGSAEKMTEGQRRYLYRLLSDQGYRGKDANEQLK